MDSDVEEEVQSSSDHDLRSNQNSNKPRRSYRSYSNKMTSKHSAKENASSRSKASEPNMT